MRQGPAEPGPILLKLTPPQYAVLSMGRIPDSDICARCKEIASLGLAGELRAEVERLIKDLKALRKDTHSLLGERERLRAEARALRIETQELRAYIDILTRRLQGKED